MSEHLQKLKAFIVAGVLIIGAHNVSAQQGNYVFSGGEAMNFGTIDLATPGGQSWATDRSATPGYFSAGNGALYTGFSDASNINGYVKKYGNQAFTFPVGDGSDLRTLSISAPAVSSDVYATAWIPGDPSNSLDPTSPNSGAHPITSVAGGIGAVSAVGQWDWQIGVRDFADGSTGTGTGLTITVSIPDMSNFATAANLRLVGWDGSSWVNLSGSSGASGNTENSTLSGTMIAGITAIAIGAVSPDLTVSTDINSLNFAVGEERDWVVDLFEVAGYDADNSVKTIRFAISKLSGFDITVPGLTLSSTDQLGTSGTSAVAGGTANENGNWYFKDNGSFIIVTAKPGVIINANSMAVIGLHIKRKTGVSANTSQNISVTIVGGSGAEVNTDNNTVTTTVTAN